METILRPPRARAPQLLDANGRHLAKAPAVRRGRSGGAGTRCVDVFAVYVLRVADEGCAFFAAGVALLEAVELETWVCVSFVSKRTS